MGLEGFWISPGRSSWGCQSCQAHVSIHTGCYTFMVECFLQKYILPLDVNVYIDDFYSPLLNDIWLGCSDGRQWANRVLDSFGWTGNYVHIIQFFYLLHLITLISIQKDVFYRIHMPIIWPMPVNIVCLQLKQAQMVTLKQWRSLILTNQISATG